MRLITLLSALLLLGSSAQAADTAPAEGVAPTACGASAAGAPCDGSGPASQGNSSGTNQGAGNPVNVITGNKYQQETDLPALPGVLGLEIVRHYNSAYADAGTPPGILGRGWKLSYETDLYAIGNTLQVVQADGTRVIFVRDPKHPSQCATHDPARGQVSILKTTRGEEYVWRWPNGRTLSFNHQGKLMQIKAPTGEFVSLTRDLAGVLVKVTDPQGRSLVLGYPARDPARFNGVAHIDSPLGRFTYAYGSVAPKGITGHPRDLLANLVAVTFPNAVSRRYVYEDRAHPTLLTGIRVEGKGGDGKFVSQRINTWAYDTQGRGILSVKGRPRQLGRDGKPVAGTGIEQVQLDFSQGGKTVLTNSLGQVTIYRHAIVGGEFRLLEVRGAGCASCGEANVRYGYDGLGRLIEETRLSQNGQPIQTTKTGRDALGRVASVSSVAYANGRAQPAKRVARYEYAGDSSEPVLIARPSVVAGKEHQVRVSYNAEGQPLSVTETGFSPLDDRGQANATAISRTTTYTYRTINGRSLLAQIDGPLANGPTGSPADSDVTRMEWDGRGNRLVRVIHPMNLAETFGFDEAGRVSQVTGADGVVTETRTTLQGQVLATWRYPARLGRQAAQDAGLLLATATRYDFLGRAVQITRADGQGITLAYDANNRLARLTDNLGNRVEWKDWNKGAQTAEENVTTQQWFTADAPAHVARAWYFWHDRLGRLTQRLSPDGGVDEWRYPDHGQPDNSTVSADSSAASANGWFTHTDPLGRLTAQARNANGTATVRIAPDGEIDARLPVADTGKPLRRTLQTQDDFGRVVQFASAQHGTATAQYNAAGQIVRIVQADGTRIDYSLDAAGRPVQKIARRANTPSGTVRFHYTAQGLASVEDSAQTTAYDYDSLGRQIEKRITLALQNKAQSSYTIRTRYDAHGRVHARQLADGNWLVFTPNPRTGLTETITLHHPVLPSITETLARWFNASDLPLLLATRKTVVTGIEANPLDGITRYVNGNGTVTDYRFDLAGRLTGIEDSIRTEKPSGAIFKASYQYDAGRRLVAEKLNANKQNASDTSYRYAGWDRLAMPGQVQPSQATAQAQLVQPLRDPAGRTLQDAQFRYTYDVWGKLQGVTNVKAGGRVIATYAHNAYGERVRASYAGDGKGQAQQTRYYLYDNQKRVAELDQDGRILQQYFYLNDTPIAVLDSTGDTELVALHTDRRGAPVAASNEQGKVIWTASYGAWGRAKVQLVSTTANESTFQIDLRLPGQWEDRATHLHYNYQRDYDPHTGRYLTPDPLGFPDGPDAYLYVGGDPVNRVDPLGLYQIDIHYYMTFFLAITAGIDYQAAHTIALATQYIDNNPATQPLNEDSLFTILGSPFSNQSRLLSYHFVLSGANGKTDPASKNGNINNPTSFQLDNLQNASLKAPTPCARFQFLGEYLHAFEDTFSHRDQKNIPYNAQGFGLGVGHGGDDSHPDYTYNHITMSPLGAGIWGVNEARTLEMEKEVFDILKGYGNPAKAKSWEDIKPIVEAFNKIPENEANTNEKFPKKLALLESALNGTGFVVVNADGTTRLFNLKDKNKEAFNLGKAKENRDKYLCDVSGKRLKKSDYPGTILPTGACPK